MRYKSLASHYFIYEAKAKLYKVEIITIIQNRQIQILISAIQTKTTNNYIGCFTLFQIIESCLSFLIFNLLIRMYKPLSNQLHEYVFFRQ